MDISKSKLSFFPLNKILSSSLNSTAPFSKNQLLTFLKPSIYICRLFGVFPFAVTENNESKKDILKTNRKWWLAYSILIFLIATVYMGFHAGSLIICVGKGHSIVELIAQSMWIFSGLTPYFVSLFMLTSSNKIVGIFHAWCKIEMELQALFCHMKTKKHIRAFRAIYFKLAFLSISLCGYHVLKEPRAPVYPFFYWDGKNSSEPRTQQEDSEIWIYHLAFSTFQMMMIGFKWAGMAVIEGLCCLFATVFIQCMESVMDGLEFVLNDESKGYEVDETLETMLKTFTTDTYKSMVDKEWKSKSSSTPIQDQCINKGKAVASTMSPNEYLIFAIRNLQTFASLQTHINSVVGPLLLLDFGQLVIMACALSFLPIISANSLDYTSLAVFTGNWVCVISRLVIIIVCLGNVYTKGQEVNVGLAKAMNSCNLNPITQSSVLAHLTVFSSNPVSFTAWGFFPITRGTLLAAFSLISTYAVVFLQFNAN